MEALAATDRSVRKIKMKRLLLYIIPLIVLGCGINVNYVYKNEIIPSYILKKQSSTFGVAIVGDTISDLFNIVKSDVLKFYDKPLKTIYVQNEYISVKDGNIDIAELKKKSLPDMEFLFAIIQNEPEISRDHYKETRTENDFKGLYVKKIENKDVDYEIYKTVLALKCDIFLYDMDSGTLIASSTENFIQAETYEHADLFPNYTLFGVFEDVLDFIESTPKSPSDPNFNKYPNIEHIEAEKLNNYFYAFLEKLTKK